MSKSEQWIAVSIGLKTSRHQMLNLAKCCNKVVSSMKMLILRCSLLVLVRVIVDRSLKHYSISSFLWILVRLVEDRDRLIVVIVVSLGLNSFQQHCSTNRRLKHSLHRPSLLCNHSLFQVGYQVSQSSGLPCVACNICQLLWLYRSRGLQIFFTIVHTQEILNFQVYSRKRRVQNVLIDGI